MILFSRLVKGSRAQTHIDPPTVPVITYMYLGGFIVLFTRQKRTEVFWDGQLKLFGYHKLGEE